MKILHIIDSAGIHGAETMLLTLATRQIAQGIEAAIGSIGLPGEGEKPVETQATARGIAVKPFRIKAGLNIFGALAIVRFALKNKFTHYHCHGYKGNILLCLLPRFIRKLPVVSTLHGWTATTPFSKIGVYVMLDKIALRFADKVVFVNGAMATSPFFLSLGKRASVIPNGIDQPQPNEKFVPDQTIKDFCEGAFVVGSIGRLSAEKAYDQLIQGFALFSAKHENAKLCIIGEGSERGKLEQRAHDLGIRDRILLPGYYAEAWRYLPLFKIYAISSLTEGLPITLLEAMYCRVPVVSTAVGGIPDVLQNGRAGILAPVNDRQALVRGFERLYGDQSLCNQMTSAAYERVHVHFTSSTMSDQYAEMYNGIHHGPK